MSALRPDRPARRITFAASLFFLIAAPAHALDVGHCDTPEGLSAKIKAEGHKLVAGMDRIGVSLKDGGKAAWGANLVTVTPDLKRWYMLRGDKPLSERSTRMCVSAAGRNLEINDHRRKGPPTVTRYHFDRAKALAECDEVAKRFIDGVEKGIRCNEFNEGLRILEEDLGERIALQGIGDHGTLMTIIANPEGEKDFRMLATAPAGATGIALSGRGFAFSAWVMTVLNKRASSRD